MVTRAGKKSTKDEEVDLYAVCSDCKESVVDSDKGLECGICHYWHHSQCQNVSENIYKALVEDSNGSQQISWTCSGCRRGAQNLLEAVSLISVRQTTLENDVKGLKDANSAIESRLGEIENSNASTASAIISEMEERKRRANSIVLFNVPESTSDSPETRKKHDISEVRNLCQELSEEAPEIESIFRFGQKNDKRPKSLRVRFKTKGGAANLFSHWTEVPLAERKKKSKVVMVQDQTPTQREEIKQLRMERDKLQKILEEEGITDQKWIITRANKLRKVKLENDL